MSLSRTTIIRGPAQIIYDGVSTYSQGDIRVSVGHETFDIINSSYGLVQQRSRQRVATVTFTPVGNFDTRFWPAGASQQSGKPLLSPNPSDPSGNDKNLIIHSYGRTGSDATKCTVFNVGITKIPDLILSTTKTIAGEITFTGLGVGSPTIQNQTTTDGFFKVEINQAPPTDVFDPDTIRTEPYHAAWGSLTSPWDDLATINGWTCTFDLGLQPIEVDQYGIIDWTIGNVRAVARGQLIGVTEKDIHDVLNIDKARGTSLVSGNDLVIQGTAGGGGTPLKVTLKSAQVRLAPMQYGLTTPRLADVEFTAVRTISASVVQPMFIVEAL